MVDNAEMFSVLIDEHTDKAGREELAICFRFIDNAGGIAERLFELARRLKETDADIIMKKSISFAFKSMNT